MAEDYLKKYQVDLNQAPAVLHKHWLRVALHLHPDHHPHDPEATAKFVEARQQFQAARQAALTAKCPRCDGTGQRQLQQGFHQVSLPCPTCDATGLKWPPRQPGV